MSATHTAIQKLKIVKTDSNDHITKKWSTRSHHLNKTHRITQKKMISPLPPAKEIICNVVSHRMQDEVGQKSL